MNDDDDELDDKFIVKSAKKSHVSMPKVAASTQRPKRRLESAGLFLGMHVFCFVT